MVPKFRPALVNEVWALREGDVLRLNEIEPDLPCNGYIAVRIVPTPLPGTPVAPYENKPNTASEQCAIVAAARNSLGEWQWCWLSPPTKERIIDVLIDEFGVERDRWYYLSIETDLEESRQATLHERQLLNCPGDLDNDG